MIPPSSFLHGCSKSNDLVAGQEREGEVVGTLEMCLMTYGNPTHLIGSFGYVLCKEKAFALL